MYVTSAEQRGGLLVCIITGGRPLLKQRATRKYIPDLRAAGVSDVAWVVSDQDAPSYERDENDLCVYPREWALDYATQHWMNTDPPTSDGFLGAFPGREWACLEAERRGCWGVLQLDDNIWRIGFGRGTPAGRQFTHDVGGLGLFADILSAVVLSTNARMVGPQLKAVVGHLGRSDLTALARPGFPYSCFVEQVGEARENWYGPFEDDITHAFQYGDRADGATTAVVPLLHYEKESRSRTGMRAQYDMTRSTQLQRLIPQGAKVGVRTSKANGRGDPRVFHTMLAGAIRNPVTIQEQDLYRAASVHMERLKREWYEAEKAANRAKVMRRLDRCS